jgi:hypothetical protein
MRVPLGIADFYRTSVDFSQRISASDRSLWLKGFPNQNTREILLKRCEIIRGVGGPFARLCASESHGFLSHPLVKAGTHLAFVVSRIEDFY